MAKQLGKKITIRSYGVIAACKVSKTLWDDVYLSWTSKPGRTVTYYGPCLCSRKDLENDIELQNELFERYADGEYLLKRRKYESLLHQVNITGLAIDSSYGDDIPNVYTSAEYIDRAEAERMIRELLKIKFGFEKIRCKWKRTNIVIMSC